MDISTSNDGYSFTPKTGIMAMRPCGGSFEFCNGLCDHCNRNRFTTSNHTIVTTTGMTDHTDYTSNRYSEGVVYTE